MVFDILCYALAIAATLAIVGSHKTPATRPVRQIDRTLATLHAIGEALPDTEECFAVEATSAGTFDCGNATTEEAALVESAEVAIAIHWEACPTANVVPFRRPAAHPALESMGIRELKKLASGKVRNYSNLTKLQLIAALRGA